MLPASLSCLRCVLQWKYVGGNNWGKCSDGREAVGCGPQEEFRACADISIGTGGEKITDKKKTWSSKGRETKHRTKVWRSDAKQSSKPKTWSKHGNGRNNIPTERIEDKMKADIDYIYTRNSSNSFSYAYVSFGRQRKAKSKTFGSLIGHFVEGFEDFARVVAGNYLESIGNWMIY